MEKTGLLQRIWIGKTEQHAPRIKVDNPTNSIGKNGVGVDILGNKIDKNDTVLFGRDYSYRALNATSVHKKIVKCKGTHININNCLNLTNCFPELLV